MPLKKEVKKKVYLKQEKQKKEIECHPTLGAKRTFGQRASDRITKLGGSWAFIIIFMIIVAIWISLNAYFLIQYDLGKPFDPFPYILLNLALSMLAAIQAPIILMSQNRQGERDRIRAEYDYSVNRKAEREIRDIRILIEKLHRRKR